MRTRCTRCTAGGLVAGLLLVACGSTEPGQRSAGDPVEEQPATTAPVEPPPHDDWGARIDPALFGPDSATIDNPWWPHTPGTQFIYEGEALDGEETIERRIITTVTDLTKEIAGVRVLVVCERDYDDDVQVEGELSYHVQDMAGNVSYL